MNEKLLYITAGRGPAECAWVVAQLLRTVLEDARKQQLEAHVVHRQEGSEPHTLESALVALRGSEAGTFAHQWQGSILWIGQSPYRRYHKRKNWFVEVFESNPPTQRSVQPVDVTFKASKSSGPGGQHVNKTMSAVTAIHHPTGLRVFVQESRSQHTNKKLALQRLEELVAKQHIDLLKWMETEEWKKKITVQRGNPSHIFEGPRFKRQ